MSMERILWFDERVRAGHRPGSGTLAAHFKVSARTARRDIEFLRERLQAPLRYDAAAKGYAYGDPGFYLPTAFFRKDEMIALLFARRLFREVKPPLRDEAATISDRLDELFKGTSLGKVENAVSFDFVRSAEAPDKVFFDLLRAITQRRIVRLHFVSPGEGDPADREIEPLKLHYFLGAWHLIGISRRRRRMWHSPVSRLRRVEVTDRPFLPPKKSPDAGLAVRRGLCGGKVRNARIRFGPGRAAWASSQSWHTNQRLQLELDGSIVLDLPDARVLEVLGLVLQQGGDATVTAPRELRDVIQAEIDRLAAAYPLR
ncbi:MAG TPA: WYL domain-containing protein [Candidatus Limnocylindrales bacterium]|nr:WYL domain-containing protein [Candidatus Limnocylindrales bacterium]